MEKRKLIPVDITDMFPEYQDLRFEKQRKLICEISHCKHSEFLTKIISQISSNLDYFLLTEVFCYLHNGKDYCDCKKFESLNLIIRNLRIDQFTGDYLIDIDELKSIIKESGKINVFDLDIQKLRNTKSDAEFRLLLASFNNR